MRPKAIWAVLPIPSIPRLQVGPVDGDSVRRANIIPRTFDEVPGFQASVLCVDAHDRNTGRSTTGLAPFSERGNHRDDRFHSRRRQSLMPLAWSEQDSTLLETFGTERGDPRIAVRLFGSCL